MNRLHSLVAGVCAVLLLVGEGFAQNGAPAVQIQLQPGQVQVFPAQPNPPPAVQPPGVNPDHKTLKDVGLGNDPKALLDYLRKQTYPEADAQQMTKLIRELGDDDFKTREAASSQLIQLGKGAVVGLKQAEADPDPEIRQRSQELRRKLEAKVEPGIQVAAARLLAQQKPEGAAEVLIGFLPFAADLTVTDEVCKALGSVAITAKGVEPSIVKALEDKHALKRGAAAEALVRAKATDYLPAVRKLLKDPDATVRVRAGVALVTTRDTSAVSDAVPALIECLKHLPPENLWAVEDILIRLAGEGKVPAASLGTNVQSREQCAKAWEAWYEKNHKDISLAKLTESEPMLGNTLMVYQNFNRGLVVGGGVRRAVIGEVMEVDMNKKVLWKLQMDDSYPVDAMVLPDRTGEVVIAEYQKARITVRDAKANKIVWEKALGGNPIGVQALVGGKFVVTLQNRIIEVDRGTGDIKTLVNRPNHDIFRAKLTRNGEIIYITNSGSLTRVDAAGKVLKQFQVPQIPVLFGNIDVLPNGSVLIPDFQQQRVVEYDTNGNQVNVLNTPWPSSAVRLPNGNTLVASQNARRVSEFNRAGQVVWTHDVDGQVFNARRR